MVEFVNRLITGAVMPFAVAAVLGALWRAGPTGGTCSCWSLGPARLGARQRPGGGAGGGARPVAGVGDRPLPAVAGRRCGTPWSSTSGPPDGPPVRDPDAPGRSGGRPRRAVVADVPRCWWWRRRRDRDRHARDRQRPPRRRRAGRPAATSTVGDIVRVHGIGDGRVPGHHPGGRAPGPPGRRRAAGGASGCTSCWWCWWRRRRSATGSTSPGCPALAGRHPRAGGGAGVDRRAAGVARADGRGPRRRSPRCAATE